MRVAVLCSSPYSETGCAVAAHLAQLGFVPVGALTLPPWDRATLVRKLGQWGLGDSLRFAATKLAPGKSQTREQVRNPYLEKILRRGENVFRNLKEVADHYSFPVVTVRDQNSARATARLKRWSSDLAIFTGGNILREELLNLPRLGVLNSHLAMLPEIRGMSSPEWSLVCGVPLGITLHFMDTGIDTGPIVLRREFAVADNSSSLSDLRNQMIAKGIELIGEAVAGLDRGTIAAVPQADREKDRQFFVMHHLLKALAEHRLRQGSIKEGGTSPSVRAHERLGSRVGPGGRDE
jgi:folate-dependent phosphoribosylglycinamide formyltransferase PurN